jgi:hypothetical protein
MIKKQRVYIDTSVIGGCFDEEFEYWSNWLMKNLRSGTKTPVISDLMLNELRLAPSNVRELWDSIPEEIQEFVILDEEAKELASWYIRAKTITEKYEEDAQHIALATINKVDVLVSWNFKHIVNFDRIRAYNSVNLRLGYSMLEIRSPREIIDEDEKI